MTVPTINVHLKNIYESGELTRDATIRKYLTVQIEGDREVSRTLDYYNLDAIISVGYRVNSRRATQFRQWATRVLTEFAIKGYVLDKKRMENGTFLGEDDFERLLADDDLELPLDSRPQHGIGTILLKGSSGGELRDIVGGPGNIVEILLCFTRRHRHLCRFLPRTHGRSGF
ncbi:virulence RhuM family protein [Methanoculleus sp. MH98A]|uniref:virulence RhuM family protein n=1 Tax=Methanoculleus sp. MH98A TaxID=1495314 RepID=UPI001E2968EE|nr:RhuM family protein [Methanoculleus sp. MH98A]